MTGDDESLHAYAIDLRIVFGKIRHVISRLRRRCRRRNQRGRSRLRTQHVASAEHARHSNAAINKKLLARERCTHERDLTSRPSEILLEYCYFLRSPFRDVFATPAATFRSACETTR